MKKLLTAAAAVAILATGAVSLNGTSALADGHKMAHHVDAEKLSMALDAQPAEAKARYEYRHPKETLEYFGIAPGMTVAEILPGGGWYSKILLPYLGEKGKLVGVDYAHDMWTVWFEGRENAAEFLERRKSWTDRWSKNAEEWRAEGSAPVTAVSFGAVPEDVKGTVDAFLWFRAIHHLTRFEDKGSYRDPGLKNMYDMLKPGGIVGVVQHRAPEGSSAEWAKGDNGYVKQSDIIAYMKAAGFELVGTSEMNANPKDKPTEEDHVWRLPPSYNGAEEGSEQRAAVKAIGESDRMTLKFRKPA